MCPVFYAPVTQEQHRRGTLFLPFPTPISDYFPIKKYHNTFKFSINRKLNEKRMKAHLITIGVMVVAILVALTLNEVAVKPLTKKITQ